MKTFILASLLVVAVNANLLEHGLKFQVFKTNFGKTYSNQVEETTRFNIFKDNLRSIEEHNALYDLGLVSYRQSVNKFSDMTTEEFRSFLKTSSARKPVLKTKPYVKTNVQIPESVDWRTEGYVTDIKDQGQCGSCWAFSITGSTEGAYYRKNQKLVSLSEQQLVDCSTNINDGCNGGYLDQTFTYVQEYGLETQESYPYTGDDDDCKYDAAKVVTKISDYVSIQEDESALEEAVATYGPVSVAMDASYLSLYDSGIYNDRFCSNFMLNHGVLVVGYGSENGKKYWIVKNSWGTSWGEDGYFRLLRGENTCGVAEDDTFPLIN